MTAWPAWNIEKLTGYKPLTSIWDEFCWVEPYGTGDVRDLWCRLLKLCSEDYRYLTELSLVLNWKIWEHYGQNEELAALYDGLWRMTDKYALKNLSGKDLEYYIDKTD